MQIALQEDFYPPLPNMGLGLGCRPLPVQTGPEFSPSWWNCSQPSPQKGLLWIFTKLGYSQQWGARGLVTAVTPVSTLCELYRFTVIITVLWVSEWTHTPVITQWLLPIGGKADLLTDHLTPESGATGTCPRDWWSNDRNETERYPSQHWVLVLNEHKHSLMSCPIPAQKCLFCP